METVKRFQKIEQRVTTATIDENGDVIWLASTENDIFLELGNVIEKRASHVEPAGLLLRVFFHALRLFGDKTRIAEWTRHWNCLWRVNTKPVGGPILRYFNVPMCDWKQGWLVEGSILLFPVRQDAIEAEVKFLNEFFLSS